MGIILIVIRKISFKVIYRKYSDHKLKHKQLESDKTEKNLKIKRDNLKRGKLRTKRGKSSTNTFQRVEQGQFYYEEVSTPLQRRQ